MLPEATTAAGAAGLAALVAGPGHALVACDFDGTLAPIVLRPEDAYADPAAVSALARVAALVVGAGGGRTVVLTGRPAETAVRLGGLDRIPGLVVLGHYGLERWEAGRLDTPRPDPGVARARRTLPPLPAGATVEEKGLSFVVHTRPCADPAGALAELDGPLRELAAREGLQVVDGSFARELRPAGQDKGSALAEQIEQVQPGSVLVLGDDDGDLPAVDAVESYRACSPRHAAVVVCAAREGGSVALCDRADVVVPGVPGVVGFLTALADAWEARVAT